MQKWPASNRVNSSKADKDDGTLIERARSAGRNVPRELRQVATISKAGTILPAQLKIGVPFLDHDCSIIGQLPFRIGTSHALNPLDLSTPGDRPMAEEIRTILAA